MGTDSLKPRRGESVSIGDGEALGRSCPPGLPALAIDPSRLVVTDLTEPLAALLGRRADQLRGKPLADILWSPSPSELASRKPPRAVFKRGDGRLLWATVTWADGPADAAVAVVADLTPLAIEAAVAQVAVKIRAASLSAASPADLAAACVEAIIAADLAAAAAFLPRDPETGRWRLAAAATASGRSDALAGVLIGPEELPDAAASASAPAPLPVAATAALARILGVKPGATVAALPVASRGGYIGLLVTTPPAPMLTVGASAAELSAATADALTTVLERLSRHSLGSSATMRRRTAARAARALDAVRRAAIALAMAHSPDAALTAVFEALRVAVAVDWAALMVQQRPSSPVVVQAVRSILEPAPLGAGAVVPRRDPAIGLVMQTDRPAAGGLDPTASSFQQALFDAGLRYWVAVPLQLPPSATAMLFFARGADPAGPFVPDEIRTLSTAAALLPLASRERSGAAGIPGLAAAPRLAEWIVHSERLQTAMDVARGVTHHLGNKLAVVVGRLERAAAAADERAREAIEQALAAADEAGECLRQLQTIAWRPAEEATTTFPISQAVRRAIEVVEDKERRWLGPRADEYSITVQSGDDAHVVGDINRLTDAFVAILENAIEAMPQGGEVNISIEALGPWVRVLVSDTGSGIPQHLADRVFAPFFSTKGAGAAGLGLTSAWMVVAKHGGAVVLCSTLRAGTTVAVYLPAGPDGPRDEGLAGE